MINKLLPVSILLSCFLYSCKSSNKPLWEKDKLRSEISRISALAKAEHVGVALMDLDTGDTLSIRGEEPYPMQSVFKLPLSIVMLHDIDKGKRSLSDKIYIEKSDIIQYSWSPVKDRYPDGDVALPISELIGYTISKSDNVSCDKMFKALGGPAYVDSCIHAIGVKGISIVADEAEMHKDWGLQYSNWCQPLEMAHMLAALYKGDLLSTASTKFLLNALKSTTTGDKRIRNLLPAKTIVMDKTGTGSNDEGFFSAVNDIGIITLPDGKQLIVAVFISNSKEKYAVLEKVIAQISKAAWDDAVSRAPHL